MFYNIIYLNDYCYLMNFWPAITIRWSGTLQLLKNGLHLDLQKFPVNWQTLCRLHAPNRSSSWGQNTTLSLLFNGSPVIVKIGKQFTRPRVNLGQNQTSSVSCAIAFTTCFRFYLHKFIFCNFYNFYAFCLFSWFLVSGSFSLWFSVKFLTYE